MFQSRRSGFGVCVPEPRTKVLKLISFSPGDRDLGFASRLQRGFSCETGSFSPGDRDLGFASLSQMEPLFNYDAFQSRRSGFGVCVSVNAGVQELTVLVSVPAIGIWGLRPVPVKRQLIANALFQSRRSGFGVCVKQASSLLSTYLQFQSRRSGFGVCVQGWNAGAYGTTAKVSVPAIGIWGLRRLFDVVPTNRERMFQSRRSGFGVCVALQRNLLLPVFAVSVPAIGIWGLRPPVVINWHPQF